MTEFKACSVSCKSTYCPFSKSLLCFLLLVYVLRLMNVYIFTLEQASDEKLRLHSKLHLFHRPMDIGFDMKGQLWVLLDSSDVPLQIHIFRKNSWEVWLDSNLHTSRYKLIILFLTSILLLIIYFYFLYCCNSS